MEPPKKKILIVGNDFHSRIGLRDSLTRAGYQVETASNSYEAIEKMEDDVSVGIFDLDLPAILGFTISGWELVGIFRAWHPNGSIIVVSDQEGYDAAKARRWRIADCLVKPITASRIKTLLKAIETERKLSAVPAIVQCIEIRKARRYRAQKIAPLHGDVL